MKNTFTNVSTVNRAEFDSDSVENCLSVFLEQADNHPEAEISEGKPSLDITSVRGVWKV